MFSVAESNHVTVCWGSPLRAALQTAGSVQCCTATAVIVCLVFGRPSFVLLSGLTSLVQVQRLTDQQMRVICVYSVNGSEDWMALTCRTQRGDEKCTQNCNWETWRDERSSHWLGDNIKIKDEYLLRFTTAYKLSKRQPSLNSKCRNFN